MKSLNLLISIGCALLLLFGCAEKKRDVRAVLTVKSIPDKAVITLKGHKSATPCVCRLPQGNYLLKIEKEDLGPFPDETERSQSHGQRGIRRADSVCHEGSPAGDS